MTDLSHDREYEAWKRGVDQFLRLFVDEHAPEIGGLEQDDAASSLHRHSMGMMDTIGRNTFDDLIRQQSKCRAGCSTCCRCNVEAAWYEAINIAKFVIWARKKDDLPPIEDAIERYAAATQGMSDAERLSARRECPFLVDHMCSIYGVRPILCRSVWATKDSRCDAGDRHIRKLFAPVAAAQLITEALVEMRPAEPPLSNTSELVTAVHYHIQRLSGLPLPPPPMAVIGSEALEREDDGWGVTGD